jgi:hypothetical protein
LLSSLAHAFTLVTAIAAAMTQTTKSPAKKIQQKVLRNRRSQSVVSGSCAGQLLCRATARAQTLTFVANKIRRISFKER